MNIAFCTCVQLGFKCIEAIYSIGGNLELLITLHDNKARKKSGRVYVDQFAVEKNIPVLKINHINDEEVKRTLKEKKIDWLFIVGWSQIASKELIATPTFGCIGAHPTLLPEGRGRAAIPWAILKALDKTGVTFFKMDEGVDTGAIIAQYEILLSETETATELYEKVNTAHSELIKKIWNKLITGAIEFKIQDENKASYWEGRTPEDGRIEYNMNVDEVDRLVRATTKPYPGAFIMNGEKKIIIWSGVKGSGEGLPIQLSDGIFTATEFFYE